MSEATIRLATPADGRAIAEVRVEAWRTTYRGLVPDAYLAAMKVEDSMALWDRILSAPPNKTNTFVAQVDGRVVGFASGLMLAEPKHGFDSELTAVYLARDAQREGLGRRLVATVAAAQRSHGATGMIVWVIAGNKSMLELARQLRFTVERIPDDPTMVRVVRALQPAHPRRGPTPSGA